MRLVASAGLLCIALCMNADLATVPEVLQSCTVCHGTQLRGNAAIGAPKLAGMEPWYLSAQLRAFNASWRGRHRNDSAGIEMRPMAAVLASEIDVAIAARFAYALPHTKAPATVGGDAPRGETLYASCAACHGAAGEGNEQLRAPRLAGQNDWYLVRQLNNYRSDIRGTVPQDVLGVQMRAAGQTLTDAQDVRDVVAYINSLP